MRRTLSAGAICLVGFVLLGAPILAPPIDEATAQSGLYCALCGLGFIAYGAVDLIRATLGRP